MLLIVQRVLTPLSMLMSIVHASLARLSHRVVQLATRQLGLVRRAQTLTTSTAEAFVSCVL